MKEIIYLILFGWVSGQFVNYCADLLPNLRRLGRPVCIACYEPQPLLAYLFWPRRCTKCFTRRTWRVWLVEFVYIGAALWLWYAPPERLGFIIAWILLVYFGLVVVIDTEHRLILHVISLTGALISLGVGVWLHGWGDTLIGGAVGFLVMLGLYYFGDLFARWLARRRGETLDEVALGFGDVNLAGVLGLLLGWPGIIAGLLFAILLGGAASLVYVIVMLLSRRYHTFMAIPYGPFLAASAIYLLYFR